MTTRTDAGVEAAARAFKVIEIAWLKRGPIHGPAWPDDAIKAAILAYLSATMEPSEEMYAACAGAIKKHLDGMAPEVRARRYKARARTPGQWGSEVPGREKMLLRFQAMRSAEIAALKGEK